MSDILTDEEMQRPLTDAEMTGSPEDHDFSFGNMVQNIPSSAATMGRNMWDAVTSPVETTKAVGKMIGGGAQLAQREIQESDLPDWLKAISFTPVDSMTDENLIPYAEVFIQGVKDRYGSVDKFQKTLEEDPVGAMVDIASVASPVAKASAAINPINAVKNVARIGAKYGTPQRLPVRIYERVAKFSTTLDDQQRAAMINTALKYGLKPSDAGVDKLAGIIKGFEGKLDDLIRASTSSGKTIPRQSVYKYLKDLRNDIGGFNFDAPDDLAVINRMVANFEEYAKAKLPNRATAVDLQKMKRGLYDRINWDARRSTGVPAGESTRKTIARGAKEGIEQLEPGVKDVNQTLSELYELQPNLQRAANRIGNRRSIPLTAPGEVGVGAATGYALGGEAGAGIGGALGAGAATVAHPRVAPGLAIGLQRLKDKRLIELVLENNPNISAAELALILSGRVTPEQTQEQTK